LEDANQTRARGKGIDRKGKHKWIKERNGRAPNYLTLELEVRTFMGIVEIMCGECDGSSGLVRDPSHVCVE
jgi:hypothetical protein